MRAGTATVWIISFLEGVGSREFADQVSISTLLTGVMLPKVWRPQRDPDRTRRIQVRDFHRPLITSLTCPRAAASAGRRSLVL